MPDKVRVVYRADGGVSVIHPAPKSQRPDESENDWLKRVFDKAMSGDLKGRPYDDVLKSTLPASRVDRDSWEWDNVNKKIKVNQGKADQMRADREKEVKIRDKTREIAIRELEAAGEL